MNNPVATVAVCLSLFAGMCIVAFLCHRYARRQLASGQSSKVRGTGSVDGAVFAMLGLLIAFTFSLAYSRFELRRDLLVSEYNAIGTAYLRLDLLPPATQQQLRPLFRDYVASKIEAWKAIPDRDLLQAILSHGEALQRAIWKMAVADTNGPENNSVRILLIPALNEMIDLATTRVVTAQAHPPAIITAMLFLTALVCAALGGLSMAEDKHISWIHAGGFALVVSAALYLILEIEYPRRGLVTLHQNISMYSSLLQSMQ